MANVIVGMSAVSVSFQVSKKPSYSSALAECGAFCSVRHSIKSRGLLQTGVLRDVLVVAAFAELQQDLVSAVGVMFHFQCCGL